MTDDEMKRQMALFRFSLIAPAVAGTYPQASMIDYFRETCGKEYRLPNGKMTTFSPLTLKKWYWLYTDRGLDALIPKARIDTGHPRVLSDDVCRQIKAYREQFPYITGKKIYEKLIEDGHMKPADASLDSIYRYMKAEDMTRNGMPQQECLAFEFEHANDCWQADTTVGPTIAVDGRHRKTYLIAFIDDASRLLVHGELFFEDNALNMQKAFQKAILKFGVPRRIFVDYSDVSTMPMFSQAAAFIGLNPKNIGIVFYRLYSFLRIDGSFQSFSLSSLDVFVFAIDFANVSNVANA